MGLLTIVLSLAVVLTIAYVGMWISGVIGFSSAIRGAACTVPAVWICATAMTEKLPISLAGRIVRMIVALLLVLGSFVVAAL